MTAKDYRRMANELRTERELLRLTRYTTMVAIIMSQLRTLEMRMHNIRITIPIERN